MQVCNGATLFSRLMAYALGLAGLEFAFSDAKRLFRHYRPTTDIVPNSYVEKLRHLSGPRP
jgi:hypothetical protein